MATPPSWFDAHQDPTWTPGLSPDMERGMADDKLRQWQSVGKGVEDAHRPSGFAAWFCSCFYYAHTSDRVNAAGSLNTGYTVAETPPSYKPSRSCFGFLLCIPFYGFLIGGMQAFVRLFYGIDGSHERDFLDGCCCPWRTLRRVNDEMLYRDQPGPITDKLPSNTSNIEHTGYLPNSPMVYPTPLPPIVEEAREIGRLASEKEYQMHSISQDPVSAVHMNHTHPHVHDVPPTPQAQDGVQRQPRSISMDPVSSVGTIPSAHEIADDLPLTTLNQDDIEARTHSVTMDPVSDVPPTSHAHSIDHDLSSGTLDQNGLDARTHSIATDPVSDVTLTHRAHTIHNDSIPMPPNQRDLHDRMHSISMDPIASVAPRPEPHPVDHDLTWIKPIQKDGNSRMHSISMDPIYNTTPTLRPHQIYHESASTTPSQKEPNPRLHSIFMDPLAAAAKPPHAHHLREE